MKRLYMTAILLAFSATCFSQTDGLTWLNSNAVSLTNYQPSLLKDVANAKVVMLGEASHGTREFYLEKNEVIKNLVKKANYRIIGFEFTDVEMAKINDFVKGKRNDILQAMQGLRAYRTAEFMDLFNWLREYNLVNKESQVEVFGFHKEEFIDPFTRDKLMTAQVVAKQKPSNAKVILWAHNIHTAKNKTMPEISAMGDYLKEEYGQTFYNIAFDTFEGTVTTMNWDDKKEDYTFKITALATPAVTGYTHLFSQVKYDNFYIALKEGNPFVNDAKAITNVMVNWRAPFALPTILGLDFNALIFIKKTTASRVLPN